jgi:hypothetical protein
LFVIVGDGALLQRHHIHNALHGDVQTGGRCVHHMAVADVAKSVAESSLFAWCGDTPLDRALMRLQARRQA